MNNNRNRILKRFTHEIYQCRPAIPQSHRTNYRIERVNGGLLCDLWFMTTGCTHDAQGGCVMCNYGKGSWPIEQERIIAELSQFVHSFPWTFEDFLLTSSGSILDECEVSIELRTRLLPLLKDIRAKRFIIETRVDTITDKGLEFVKQAMPQAETYIELGLESSDNWVLKNCINKGITFESFCDAVELIHAHGIRVTANVGLGFPFMSERASVLHTIRTIRDALAAGVDSVVVFPYHIKQWTLLDVMHRNGMYDCVSLWALVKVLEKFPQEQEKVQISWYKDYLGEQRSYIYSSPGTCEKCYASVMEMLDLYRENPQPKIISQLSHYPCECYIEWEKKLESQPKQIVFQLVEQMYRKLGALYSIEPLELDRELTIMKREYEELKET